MENFIVLGIIPGTNYQTTFSFWLGVAASLLAIVLFIKLWRNRYGFYTTIAARRIARVINQYQIQA